jgi:CheY-like chemotaxis protein
MQQSIARRSMSIRKIRVLVAEDDEVNAKAARMMLEQLGCQVDVATDGTEAVEHFRNRDYDLVLMDWQMPLMNGIEATARIRALPGGAATPIVGTTTGKAHAECLKGGMNEVVPKPFLFDKLRYVLSRWTGWTGAPQTGPCEA